jgi:CHASE3 domain sensor protein
MDREEKIVIKRHEEVLGALKGVANALSGQQKDDPELKKLMSENRDAINNFVKAVGGLKNQEKQEVKVETNQNKVVSAIEDLGKVMEGIGKRLTELETKEEKPLPVKLKAERGYNGEITYVIIEYANNKK